MSAEGHPQFDKSSASAASTGNALSVSIAFAISQLWHIRSSTLQLTPIVLQTIVDVFSTVITFNTSIKLYLGPLVTEAQQCEPAPA